MYDMPKYGKYKQNRQGLEQSLAIHKLGKFNLNKAWLLEGSSLREESI